MEPDDIADLLVRAEKALAQSRKAIKRYHKLQPDLTPMTLPEKDTVFCICACHKKPQA
jgi:hypothetical protein